MSEVEKLRQLKAKYDKEGILSKTKVIPLKDAEDLASKLDALTSTFSKIRELLKNRPRYKRTLDDACEEWTDNGHLLEKCLQALEKEATK